VLLTLNTRNVLDESVISTERNIQNIGKEQYTQYCKDVIIECTRSIHDPIKKNSLLFSAALSQRKESKLKSFLCSRVIITLFSRLYIIMHWDSDMTTFFSYENHPFPPSLSDGGKLCFGKKSDLLDIIVNDVHCDPPNFVDVNSLLWCTYFLQSMLLLSMNMRSKSFYLMSGSN